MTFQPSYRPNGRSVWLGKDLVRTDDWIVRLSPATLEEIDAAVRRLRGRNAYDTPVARAASRPRTPIRAGKSASSPCSA